MTTLPELCRENRWSLDTMREFVRSHNSLRKMGRMLGTARIFTAEEAAQIVAAWRERQAKRRAPEPSAAN